MSKVLETGHLPGHGAVLSVIPTDLWSRQVNQSL